MYTGPKLAFYSFKAGNQLKKNTPTFRILMCFVLRMKFVKIQIEL